MKYWCYNSSHVGRYAFCCATVFNGWAKNQTQWSRQVQTGHHRSQNLSQFWLVVCTMVIRSTGIQFALVCPIELDFLLDRWNPLLSRMHVSPELWRLAYKWLELWGFKYDLTLLQIYLKGRILKKFSISIYFWRFMSIEFKRVDGVFPTFSSYIFCPSCFAQHQKPTQNNTQWWQNTTSQGYWSIS